MAHTKITTRNITDDAVTSAKLDTNIAISGTLASTGVLTANAGVVVDNITIDGTEIDLSSGDLTLDVAGDIILDADGGDIRFKDGGTEIGLLTNDSTNFGIFSRVDDVDIKFYGLDNGSTIAALTLDMSEAGSATFNHDIIMNTGGTIRNTSGQELQIGAMVGDGSNTIIKSAGDTIFQYYNGSAWVENVRFDDGKVGIGTASPGDLLHITNGDNAVDTRIRLQAFGQLPILHTYYAAGTESSPTAPTSGTELSRIAVATYDGSDYSQSAANIRVVASANHASNSAPAYIAFDTNSTTRLATEKMRIDSEGRLLLGTTTEGRFNEGADKFTIGSTGASGMTIRSGTTSYGTIYFSDATSGAAEYAGYVQYDHTNDKLLLGVGGSNVIVMDNAGAVTKPSQPCFSAALPAATSSGSAIVWGGEHLDIGGHFNTSNGRFTAPVSGNYYFSFWILLDPGGAGHYSRVLFRKNGTSSTQWTDNLESTAPTATDPYHSVGGSCVMPLSANDYVDLLNDGQNPTYGTSYGNFSGFLVS
jgi:hypothetical protein